MSASSPAAPGASAPTHTSSPRGLLGSSRNRALLIAGLIILGFIFLFGGDAWLTVIDITLIAAIATLGLNVLSGYAGQVSLGISFFMAIGAYTSAWLGGNLPSPSESYRRVWGSRFLSGFPRRGSPLPFLGRSSVQRLCGSRAFTWAS